MALRRRSAAASRSHCAVSTIPVAESRSSYNGLLVFLFVAASASLAAYAIHHLASRAVRRAPAWDCGFPNAGLATQYTADSFSQPIRRVFGAYVFRTRVHVEIPPPGDVRPARFTLELHDLAWEFIYTPIANGVAAAAMGYAALAMLVFETGLRRYQRGETPASSA
jgi:hydrogenase-4 component B